MKSGFATRGYNGCEVVDTKDWERNGRKALERSYHSVYFDPVSDPSTAGMPEASSLYSPYYGPDRLVQYRTLLGSKVIAQGSRINSLIGGMDTRGISRSINCHRPRFG